MEGRRLRVGGKRVPGEGCFRAENPRSPKVKSAANINMWLVDFFCQFVEINIQKLTYIAVIYQIRSLYATTFSIGREFNQLLNNLTVGYDY